MSSQSGWTVWTIGHSTRSSDELVEVLRAHDIGALLDVRRFPASRRLPQFHAAVLEASLDVAGIAYQWVENLGGRRRAPDADVPSGWRHPAFRAYASYSTSEEFADGLAQLVTVSHAVPTAIMCAEVLWWRCHRRIVSDVLVSLGARVFHIADARAPSEHRLTAPGRLSGGVLTYSVSPPR